MHQLLDSLELQLRETVSRAGLTRTDAGEAGGSGDREVGRLEYRWTSSNPRRLLLDFFLIESEQKINASTDPEALAGEVTATVAQWLE